jgi:hypothetical protein
MTQSDNVFGELAHRRPVVDTDPGGARHVVRLIDHHHRKLPLLHHRQIRIVVAGRVDDEAVDARGQHGRGPVRDAAVRPDRHQQQPLPHLLARFGKSGNEIECGRIAERIVQRFGDHQADRTGPPGAQRAGDGVRAGVAELLRGGEDALAQFDRQLVRPVVGIGDRGARDLELGGQ